MEHWSERYIGRRYIAGEFDCADLAELVQKEVFGREVHLPKDRDYAGKTGVAKLRAMADQIAREKDRYAAPTDSPSDGDAVLMTGRGRDQHIGVLCVIGADKYVLHGTSSYGHAVLSLLRNIDRHGLAVEGFYKWT
jgi:hypothetical protein